MLKFFSAGFKHSLLKKVNRLRCRWKGYHLHQLSRLIIDERGNQWNNIYWCKHCKTPLHKLNLCEPFDWDKTWTEVLKKAQPYLIDYVFSPTPLFTSLRKAK